ncbi:hypothetical protein BJY01DRAFT_158772 [Aspergillus pseudoustus]|uniref:Transmembrane protein n=1 Tax=Aspergillus pseudoustus TaxID=1810923 RepID=A0ABR4KXW8_9EURO
MLIPFLKSDGRAGNFRFLFKCPCSCHPRRFALVTERVAASDRGFFLSSAALSSPSRLSLRRQSKSSTPWDFGTSSLSSNGRALLLLSFLPSCSSSFRFFILLFFLWFSLVSAIFHSYSLLLIFGWIITIRRLNFSLFWPEFPSFIV